MIFRKDFPSRKECIYFTRMKLSDCDTHSHPWAHLALDKKKKNLAPSQTVTLVTQPVVTKETAISKLEMPSSLLLEVPALADFNRAWTELTDWLSLLDRVIKSQRVMVGDLEDINEMIIKQKVWAKKRKASRSFSFKWRFSTSQFTLPDHFAPVFRQLFSVRKHTTASIQLKCDQGNKLMQLS